MSNIRQLVISCVLIPVTCYALIQVLFLCSELIFQETASRFENVFLDRLFISRHRESPVRSPAPVLTTSDSSGFTDNILLITIEKETLDGLRKLEYFKDPKYQSWNLSQWPFDRRVMGEAIQLLQKYKASVIGLDLLYLHQTDPEQDTAFAKILNSSENVVLASMLEHTSRGELIGIRKPMSGLIRDDFPTGFVNVATATDGIVRTLPLRYQSTTTDQHFSFALTVFMQKPMYRSLDLGNARRVENQLVIPHTDLTRSPKAIYLWPDPSPTEHLLINWKGPAGSFKSLKFMDLFDPKMTEELKSQIPGRIILVGLNHPGLQDVYPTPFYGMDKLETPGVEIHANAVNTLMTVTNGSIRKYSPSTNLAIYLLFSIFLCGAAALLKIWISFPIFIAEGLGAWLLSNYLLQKHNALLSHADTALSLSFCYICVLFYRALIREKEKSEIRKVFNQYVSNQVVDELLDSPDNLSLGGNSLEISTLFSDIRGFTSMVEKKTPENVVNLLNRYFELMVSIISKHGGTINKFIGDAVMVLYGAPLMSNKTPSDQALACLKTAIEMQETLKMSNDEGIRELAVGIGITTGYSVVGNIGAKKHRDYTAIGDRINLAARLQSQCQAFEIIVDQSTYLYCKEHFQFEALPPFQVKGKEEVITAYKVLY